MDKNISYKQALQKKPSGPKRQVVIVSKKGNNKTNKQGSKANLELVVKDEPLVKSTKVMMKGPKYAYSKEGAMTLSHCELITEVTSANSDNTNNGFNLLGFHVNAGLKSSFPFASALASNYKSYEFLNLTYIFVARGNFTRDGAIMFYAEYDPSIGPPENRKEFLNRSNAVEAQVFKNLDYSLSPKDMRKEKTHYVRLSDLEEGEDVKLYDTAVLWFAYEGTPKNTLLGDIFVSYTLKLTTPTLRLAEKQISYTEQSELFQTSGITQVKPLGNVSPGQFVGTFIKDLLDVTTGGLIPGAFFSTAKSVVKLISGWFSGNSPAGHDIQIRHPTSNVFSKLGSDSIFIEEDTKDLLALALNASDETAFNLLFDDWSTTNVVSKLNIASDATYNGRFQQWLVMWPADCLMRLVNPSVAPNSVVFRISDYDGRKTGDFDPTTVKGF